MELVMKHIAYIAIGSNLGDKLSNCKKGIEALEFCGVKVSACSRFYKTAPVDYTDQDWFINAVIRIDTNLQPIELLKLLKAIEKQLGRVETVRFGPRVLDMDIIFYDDLVFEKDALIIPHPRMHKRGFVLRPICDIEPDFIHPALKQDMKTLLSLVENDPSQEVSCCE